MSHPGDTLGPSPEGGRATSPAHTATYSSVPLRSPSLPPDRVRSLAGARTKDVAAGRAIANAGPRVDGCLESVGTAAVVHDSVTAPWSTTPTDAAALVDSRVLLV